MNQQPIEDNERDTKRADQLTAGDHVIEIPGYERNEQPMRVTYAQPYRDGNRRPMVALLLDALDGTEPMYARVSPEREYDLASDGEVSKHRAAAEDLAHRAAVAKALHQLAADIVAQALPVPRWSFAVDGVLGSRGELERWAEHLGVDIRMSGDIPVADREAGGLRVHFQSSPEPAAPPQPEPEPEGLDSMSDLAAGMAAAEEAGVLPVEAGPTDCTCWATSRNGCPVHADAHAGA